VPAVAPVRRDRVGAPGRGGLAVRGGGRAVCVLVRQRLADHASEDVGDPYVAARHARGVLGLRRGIHSAQHRDPRAPGRARKAAAGVRRAVPGHRGLKMKRYLMLAMLVLMCGVSVAGQAQPQTQPPAQTKEGQKPAAQDEFVPVDKPTNAQDTIPAPRRGQIAYGFIWVVLLGYVWSVRSRLSSVERELQTVSKRVGTERR